MTLADKRQLDEAFRVLKPGGAIMISVPDLETLCGLFVKLPPSARGPIMQMIFGAQGSPYDFHKVGLYWDLLCQFLTQAGFISFKRVEDFGLFDDTSRLVIDGTRISLNVIAQRLLV